MGRQGPYLSEDRPCAVLGGTGAIQSAAPALPGRCPEIVGHGPSAASSWIDAIRQLTPAEPSGHYAQSSLNGFQRESMAERGRTHRSAGVTPHGLRLSAATRLKELGLSWDVIASITGHDTKEMVEHYTEQERKAKIAIGVLNAATAEQNATEIVKPGSWDRKTDAPTPRRKRLRAAEILGLGWWAQ
ncbi:tyrosine-type recombinase/integrase [Rhodospirillaceae bacterium R-7]|uniref:Tyrosine-type recombinase/integrase n=2 Tax=Dongia sedimenti TaxID=3064282 RepID=A0ABU0YG18_9PROT|nr:tyrosine-type recombinase/integrase [Rhodospirillaceae bacterium R-7]